MEEPEQMMKKAALTFIQKVIREKKPDDLVSLLRIRKEGARDTRIHLKYAPRTMNFQRVFFNSAIDLFNTLDIKFTSIDPKKFKILLKKYNINIDPG